MAVLAEIRGAWLVCGADGDGRARHVGADQLGRRLHEPTGRVSVEAVLRMLLDELEVLARRGVLAETEARFVAHRR